MSEPLAGGCRRRPRLHAAGACLALGAVLAAPLRAAQAASQRPAAAPAPQLTPGGPAAQQAPPKLPAKTPRQMAEQLAVILAKQKSPSQVYASYARVFEGFAAREAAAASAQPADAARKRLVEQLSQMAGLLTAMAAQARTRDEIRRGSARLPLEQRQPVFAQAGVEHERLLAEFVRLGAALPKGK